jgi:hypothetical protein
VAAVVVDVTAVADTVAGGVTEDSEEAAAISQSPLTYTEML